MLGCHRSWIYYGGPNESHNYVFETALAQTNYITLLFIVICVRLCSVFATKGLGRRIRKTKAKTWKWKDPEGPSERGRNATSELGQNEKGREREDQERKRRKKRYFKFSCPERAQNKAKPALASFSSPTISEGLPTDVPFVWTGGLEVYDWPWVPRSAFENVMQGR